MASKLTKNEMKTVYAFEEIRRYRNEGCYSQEYIANQLGIAQSTYQRIETGEISVTMDRMIQIAAILNKPIEAFFRHEQQADPNKPMIQISPREWDLLQMILSQQEKRIEELEAKLQRRDMKIEELKLNLDKQA